MHTTVRSSVVTLFALLLLRNSHILLCCCTILVVGIVFFIVLLSGVPGSQLGRAITAYTHNPVLSLGCCNLFFIASTLIASGTCHACFGGWIIMCFPLSLSMKLCCSSNSFKFLFPSCRNSRIAWPGRPTSLLHFWILLGSLPGLVATTKYLRLYSAAAVRQCHASDGNDGPLRLLLSDLVLVTTRRIYHYE